MVNLFLALILIGFVTSQSIEITHPLEDDRHQTHRHAQEPVDFALECQDTSLHNHYCLHQQSLAAGFGILRLVPHLSALEVSFFGFEEKDFLSAQILHLRGPPLSCIA